MTWVELPASMPNVPECISSVRFLSQSPRGHRVSPCASTDKKVGTGGDLPRQQSLAFVPMSQNWLVQMKVRSDSAVTLSPEQRALLEQWVRGRTSSQRLVLRSRIVLLAAQGLSDRAITQRLNVSRQTIRLWERRFVAVGPHGLAQDAPGRGRKPTLPANAVATALARPRSSHPTIRQLAEELGASRSAVHRALAASKGSAQWSNTQNPPLTGRTKRRTQLRDKNHGS